MPDTYTHGHHDSVLRAHRWRSAANSAAYLLPALRSGMALLDVGCGPGTITVELAERVAPGRVVGLDASAEVIDQARAAAGPDAKVEFVVGDLYHLDMEPASFDVVHAHQVLQHLSDPVGGLVSLRRVLRPGGLLAVRDGDYGAFAWAPADPGLARWMELYHDLTARNGAEADAGRHLLGWVQRAGFSDEVASSSTWTFADPAARRWWGGLWAERVEHSAFARQAVAYGLSDGDELASIAAAWRRWIDQPDGFFCVVHAEVLARA